MLHEQPHEKIRVLADFQKVDTQERTKRVKPIAFFWGGKRYDVASINLVYRRKKGMANVWCFAVSDSANSFVLSYDPETLEWMLDEIQGM